MLESDHPQLDSVRLHAKAIATEHRAAMSHDQEGAVGVPMDDGRHRTVGLVTNGIAAFHRPHQEFRSIGERHLANGALGVIGIDEREIVIADEEFESVGDRFDGRRIGRRNEAPFHEGRHRSCTPGELTTPGDRRYDGERIHTRTVERYDYRRVAERIYKLYCDHLA